MTKSTVAQTIGANITAERKARGKTQGWLADRLGMGQSRLSNIESGSGAPGVETLLRIAEILDCPLLALIKGTQADTDAYRKGYEDGWSACADDVSGHLTWKPKGGAA